MPLSLLLSYFIFAAMKFRHFPGFTARHSFQIFLSFSCLCSPLSAGGIAGSYNICLSFLLTFETFWADCDGAVGVCFFLFLSIQSSKGISTLGTQMNHSQKFTFQYTVLGPKGKTWPTVVVDGCYGKLYVLGDLTSLIGLTRLGRPYKVSTMRIVLKRLCSVFSSINMESS